MKSLLVAVGLIGACAHDAPPAATLPPPPAPKAAAARDGSPPVLKAVPAPDDSAPQAPPGTKVVVALLLRIDATGRVADASVVESAGAQYDAHAVKTLLATRFKPGLGPDGVPVEWVLRWRVIFDSTRE